MGGVGLREWELVEWVFEGCENRAMLLRAMIDGRGHIDLSLVASALCPSR